MPHDVFISYCTVDRGVAEKICRSLESRGISCWMAPRDVAPGSLWAEQIVKAIKECKVLVLVFSRRVNESEHIPREILMGMNNKLHILPYRIEPATPEGVLEYCLCVTHWLDAFSPHDVNNINRLCAEVQEALRVGLRGVSKSYDFLAFLKEKKYRSVLVRLAEEMVRQGQTFVSLEAFSRDEQTVINELETLGPLREVPSFHSPDKCFITIPNPEECQKVLDAWLTEQMEIPPLTILRQAERFPVLADAISRFLLSQPVERWNDLMPKYADLDLPIVERISLGLLEQFETTTSHGNGSVEEKMKRLVEILVASSKLPAMRGLVRGAQNLMSHGRLHLAEELFDALEGWKSPTPEDPSVVRFMIEKENERGRLERRQGMIDVAEKRLRQTLRKSETFGDDTLIGVIVNNLTRVLLDASSKERMEEAIRLLRGNVTRLSSPSQRRHLAVTFNNLADALAVSDPKEAEAFFRADIRISKESKDDLALCDALDGLAGFYMDQGRYCEAQEILLEECAICERFLDLRRNARALANLGRAHFVEWKQSRSPEALWKAHFNLRKSWIIFSSLDEPRLFAPTLENLGRVEYLLGHELEGLNTMKASIEQYQRWPQGKMIAAELEAEIKGLPDWPSNHGGERP